MMPLQMGGLGRRQRVWRSGHLEHGVSQVGAHQLRLLLRRAHLGVDCHLVKALPLLDHFLVAAELGGCRRWQSSSGSDWLTGLTNGHRILSSLRSLVPAGGSSLGGVTPASQFGHRLVPARKQGPSPICSHKALVPAGSRHSLVPASSWHSLVPAQARGPSLLLVCRLLLCPEAENVCHCHWRL